MLHLRRYKIALLSFFLLGTCFSLSAQRHSPNYDNERRLHFGFSLIGNRADFKIVTAPNLYDMDTFQTIAVKPFSGFGIGMLADYRLFEFGNLRILPCINFCQRNVLYTFKGGVKRELKVESTYLDLPVLIKIKSERINDWRFYLVGGAKYSFDLQARKNQNPNPADPTIPLSLSTFSYEFGAGMDFYFEFFKFSPEIKISNNINNALGKSPLIFSQAMSGIYGQLIQISLHFE